MLVGIKDPCNNSPTWKPSSGGVGNTEKGHTKQQSLFSFLITGEHLQLIKRSGCVNYISYSNKKRQPLLISLASRYYFDLQLTTYIKKLSDKQICRLTRLLLTPHAEILQPLLQLKQIKVKTTEATYPCLVRPLAQHNTAANFAPHAGLNWSTRGKKNKSKYSELKAVRS